MDDQNIKRTKGTGSGEKEVERGWGKEQRGKEARIGIFLEGFLQSSGGAVTTLHGLQLPHKALFEQLPQSAISGVKQSLIA